MLPLALPKMDKHSAHSIKKDSRALSDNIPGFSAKIVSVLRWVDFLVFLFFLLGICRKIKICRKRMLNVC